MPNYIDWLAKGLEKPEVDVGKVAAALDKHISVVYKMLDGKRRIHLDEVTKIARAIGEPVPLDGEAVLPTKSFLYRKHVILNNSGHVSAGKFAPVKPAAMDDITVVFRDEEHAKVQHMVFCVSGKLLESNCVSDGDKLFCLDYEGMGGLQAIKEGVPVIVERTRKGKVELAAKLATLLPETAKNNGDAYFHAASQIGVPSSGTKKTTTATVKIIAVARQVIRTFR